MHCQLASSSILLAWHIPCFSLSGCLGRCVKPAACCVGLSLGQLVCLLASYLHCCRGLCRRPRTLMCPRFLPMWPVAAHISWGFGVFALACCLLCCSCTHMGVVRQVHAWPGAAHGRFAGCIHPDNVCSPVGHRHFMLWICLFKGSSGVLEQPSQQADFVCTSGVSICQHVAAHCLQSICMGSCTL